MTALHILIMSGQIHNNITVSVNYNIFIAEISRTIKQVQCLCASACTLNTQTIKQLNFVSPINAKDRPNQILHKNGKFTLKYLKRTKIIFCRKNGDTTTLVSSMK